MVMSDAEQGRWRLTPRVLILDGTFALAQGPALLMACWYCR